MTWGKLEQAWKRRFRFLVEEHHFAAPEAKEGSRWFSLSYRRDDMTLKIHSESGCAPWVTVRRGPKEAAVGLRFYADGPDAALPVHGLKDVEVVEQAARFIEANAERVLAVDSPAHAEALARMRAWRAPPERPPRVTELAEACLQRFAFLVSEQGFDEPDIFVVRDTERVHYLKPLVTISFDLAADAEVSAIVTSERQHPLPFSEPVYGEDGLDRYAKFFNGPLKKELGGEIAGTPGLLERLDALWRAFTS